MSEIALILKGLRAALYRHTVPRPRDSAGNVLCSESHPSKFKVSTIHPGTFSENKPIIVWQTEVQTNSWNNKTRMACSKTNNPIIKIHTSLTVLRHWNVEKCLAILQMRRKKKSLDQPFNSDPRWIEWLHPWYMDCSFMVQTKVKPKLKVSPYAKSLTHIPLPFRSSYNVL